MKKYEVVFNTNSDTTVDYVVEANNELEAKNKAADRATYEEEQGIVPYIVSLSDYDLIDSADQNDMTVDQLLIEYPLEMLGSRGLYFDVESVSEIQSESIIKKYDKYWIEDDNGDIVAVKVGEKVIKLGDKVQDDYVTGFEPETNTIYLNEDPNVDGGRDYDVEDVLSFISDDLTEAVDKANISGVRIDVLTEILKALAEKGISARQGLEYMSQVNDALKTGIEVEDLLAAIRSVDNAEDLGKWVSDNANQEKYYQRYPDDTYGKAESLEKPMVESSNEDYDNIEATIKDLDINDELILNIRLISDVLDKMHIVKKDNDKYELWLSGLNNGEEVVANHNPYSDLDNAIYWAKQDMQSIDSLKKGSKGLQESFNDITAVRAMTSDELRNLIDRYTKEVEKLSSKGDTKEAEWYQKEIDWARKQLDNKETPLSEATLVNKSVTGGEMRFDIEEDGTLILYQDGKEIERHKVADPENTIKVLKELGFKEKEAIKESFKVVDKDGKKVPQGGGFTSKKEAEMFAAQYGEKGLKVVKESFEEDKKYKSIVVRDNASQAEWYFELNNNHELDGDTIKAHAEYCVDNWNGFNVEKFQDLVDCENVTFKKSIEDLAKPIYLFNVKHLRESFEDEHLGEASKEIIPDAVKPGPDAGIAFELNALIQDEWEAIQGYNDAIVTAETEGFHDIAKVLKDIVNEENLHVGQLEQCMKLVSPNADSIDQGEAEASEQLTQNEVNSIN